MDDTYALGLTALVTVGFQLSFFFVAYTCQFDKITDLAGASNFALLAILTLCLGGTFTTRQIVNTALLLLWAMRLGSFLLYRVLKRESDARFDEMRSNFFAFLGFWVFQMFWVWTVSLPLTILNMSTLDRDIRAQDVVGWVLWGSGFLLEAVADQSKLMYTQTDPKERRTPFLQSGVWRYSRHPNYAGEIMLWIGMFITCATAFRVLPNGVYASIMSPLFTFMILMFLSGVNLAEERYNQRYGKLDVYIKYRQETSPLIPLPVALYRKLPLVLKRVLFCEFPMYDLQLPEDGSYQDVA